MKLKLLLAFVAFSTQFSIAQQFGKSFGETPGIVSFTYRKSFQKDIAATLDTIKRMGITNIEFSNLFGKTAEQIKEQLDARGMRCTSFGVGYPDIVDKIDDVGKNAKTLGASFVRVAWIPHDAKAPISIDLFKKAAEDFNTAGRILKEKYGMTFCYHNHGWDLAPYEGSTFLDYLITHTDPAFVSFELDILWVFHPGQDPALLLSKYSNRFKLMHLKDLKKGVKGDLTGATSTENNVALGTGQIDIASIIKAAKKSSMQYYYIEDESNSVNTQVPLSLKYLKGL